NLGHDLCSRRSRPLPALPRCRRGAGEGGPDFSAKAADPYRTLTSTLANFRVIERSPASSRATMKSHLTGAWDAQNGGLTSSLHGPRGPVVQYNNNGTLHAISIVQGQLVEKWSVNYPADRIQPGREIAGGNIDGIPGNELVVCTEEGKVR